MRPRKPELLLLFYVVLPINQGALVALVLLSQIRAIYVARQAEKKLILDGFGSDEPDLEESNSQELGDHTLDQPTPDQSTPDQPTLDQSTSDQSTSDQPIAGHFPFSHAPIVKEFLSALWLDPSNTSACAYSGMLLPSILFPSIMDSRLQTPAEGFDRL